MKVCKIENCGKRVAGRGWCQMHYRRWSKYGDPRPDMPPQRVKQQGQCTVDGCAEEKKNKGYCGKHYQRVLKYGDPHHVGQIRNNNAQRFWAYVDTSGGESACWPWRTAGTNGYGMIYVNGAAKKDMLAHRFAYELLVGPIPEGMVIDHTCHNPASCNLDKDCPHRRCCNPRHLEPVSTAENNHRGNTWSGRNVRKTHCPQGHPYDEENTRLQKDGVRVCITCSRARTLDHYHRTKKLKS